MVTQSSKRPFCPSCSKPTRTCLCTRFKTSKINNSVSITILQHSLEKNHPLNSARIAALGLKNVQIVSVFDVNFQAKFSIRVLDPDTEMGSGYIGERSDFYEKDGKIRLLDPVPEMGCGYIGERFDFYEKDGKIRVLDPDSEMGSNYIGERSDFYEKDGKIRVLDPDTEMGSGYIGERFDFCEKDGNFGGFKKNHGEVIEDTIDFDGKVGLSNDFEGGKVGENCYVSAHLAEKSGSCTLEVQECVENGEPLLEGIDSRSSEEADIDFRIVKYGVASSWMAKGQLKEMSFEKLMDCKETVDGLARGFVVKKLQRKQINGSFWDEDSEEFEIVIPQGSVLLFPSEKSVGIGELQCEVKNLIVLDGTWSKARRMYNENPWLKALPHLKLDVDKMSLYNEVRQQPKAGYLSTIESIVYSLKAVGDDCGELDGLLDVFESMVGDQRRFKDERLNEEST